MIFKTEICSEEPFSCRKGPSQRHVHVKEKRKNAHLTNGLILNVSFSEYVTQGSLRASCWGKSALYISLRSHGSSGWHKASECCCTSTPLTAVYKTTVLEWPSQPGPSHRDPPPPSRLSAFTCLLLCQKHLTNYLIRLLFLLNFQILLISAFAYFIAQFKWILLEINMS